MASSRGVVIPTPARYAFGAVQSVSQSLAARLAERWFFTPPRSRVTSDVAAWLRSGHRFTLRVARRQLVGWAWGTGPVVYLVHGWGSRGGRLGAFAKPLLAAGYRVVTFDAPGHGASGRGLSSMPEFARALRAVAEEHGPAHAVIAHSLGGAAAVIATRWGFTAERFALLAPAADPAAFADAFAAALGARPEVMKRMRVNSEQRLSFHWADLDVCAVATRMPAALLVIHDRDDDVVPFAEGAAIAASWPGGRLLATTGLGHRGVVRDPTIVTEVVRFVTDTVSTAEPSDEAGHLEHELFYRESRWLS